MNGDDDDDDDDDVPSHLIHSNDRTASMPILLVDGSGHQLEILSHVLAQLCQFPFQFQIQFLLFLFPLGLFNEDVRVGGVQAPLLLP